MNAESGLKIVSEELIKNMSDTEKRELEKSSLTGPTDHKNHSLKQRYGSNRFSRYLNMIKGFFLNSQSINNAIKKADEKNNEITNQGR